MDEDDFIQWVIETKPDPWSTMANDYILWEKKDRSLFDELWKMFGDDFKKQENRVKISNTPHIIIVIQNDGSELEMESRTNYTFAKLLQLYLEETKQQRAEGRNFAKWLLEQGYYEKKS